MIGIELDRLYLTNRHLCSVYSLWSFNNFINFIYFGTFYVFEFISNNILQDLAFIHFQFKSGVYKLLFVYFNHMRLIFIKIFSFWNYCYHFLMSAIHTSFSYCFSKFNNICSLIQIKFIAFVSTF